MLTIRTLKRLILAAPLVAALLTASPALAQGEGPFAACLETFRGDASAFEDCLIEHQGELEAAHALPGDWITRLHGFLQAHPDGWDRIEDLADALENRWDRRENARDRREDRRDHREDRHDDTVDLEDVFDRLEDARDRAEDCWDRRELVRDRLENRWDRRH